ncbi:MAG: glucose 1-dehydrogenase [Thermomicrobiales bacterium]|nr:glucose 1-dehydrogenase [Thermomicrobiales bacterium]
MAEPAAGALAGKTIFVTGAARGIGSACAAAYLRAGAHVAIADRDEVMAVHVAAELGERAFAIACDVSDGASVAAAVSATVAHFGGLDAVHTNAGISSPSKPLHETTDEEWDDLQRVNLKSVLLTCRAAFPHLRERRGCVLNTASMVGLIGQENHAAYVATKGGMIALTKAMALDYAPLGMRVNAICPAGVRTPLLEQWVSEQPDPAAMERYLAAIHPLGYCPGGDVVADAAVFLLSESARFITGCILPVSGGAELGYRR